MKHRQKRLAQWQLFKPPGWSRLSSLGRAALATQQEQQAPNPCPFCGSAQLKIRNQPGAYTVYFVECPECQARGPVASSEEKTKATWIQRAK